MLEGQPLQGYRIIELCDIWAGPFCGELLGDLGAEVVKIEAIQRIGRGQLRPSSGRDYPDGEPGEHPWNRSANFNALNRNKRGITLDLAHPRGLAVFKELVSVSDAFFCNFALRVLENLDISYDDLRKIRPDIIFMPTPGFGTTGPYKHYRSMGMTLDAFCGHSAMRGYPNEELSTITPFHHPDAIGGATAAFAIIAALWHRATTGQGQHIDLSQVEASIPHLGEFYLDWAMNQRLPERRGNGDPTMAPHGCYPCKPASEDPEGDAWVTIACTSDVECRALCRLIGRPDPARDSQQQWDELDSTIRAWAQGLTAEEAVALLQEAGIPAGPVLNVGPGQHYNRHLQERGFFQPVMHPEAGEYLLPASLWRTPRRRAPAQGAAPCLGEHNRYILGELLGITDRELTQLEAEQVIGTVPLEGADMGRVRRLQRMAERS